MEASTPPAYRPEPTAFTRLLVQWHRYKKLLLSKWWLVLAVLGIFLGAEWLLIQGHRGSFVSDGQMIVNVKLSIPSENTYSEELENFYGTQVALMQSDSVVNRVNARLNPSPEAAKVSHVKIQVSLAPKTSIFNLQAFGPDASYTQAYLEATMEEYINLKKDLLANASAAAKSNLQNELAQLAVKLNQSKQDYLDFQSSNSIVLLQGDGGNSAAAYLSALSKQRAGLRSDLELLNSLTLDENMAQAQAGQPGEVTVAGGQASDPVVASEPGLVNGKNLSPSMANSQTAYRQAKEQVLILKVRRDSLSRQTPNAFELDDLNDQIANQEKLVMILAQQGREDLENRRHTLQVEIQHLDEQVAEWEAKALDASKKLSVFQALGENQKQLQTMNDQLLANLQTLDVDKGSGQEGVTILEPATSPVPVPPRGFAHMIMAALLGLCAGCGLLLFLDQMNDRPSSFLELEALFDRPVLAQFPKIKAVGRKACVPVLQPEDDRHTLVEAYQNLRSALIYKDGLTSHPRSIVITSACGRDGKSTVSANFAITLALSGSRVLLVDADLRRGILHEQFGASPTPGLAEVLGRQCDWTQAVVPTVIPNLFLMPAGARPRRPGSLFAMHTVKFLSEISGQYDYYLFDTAPVLAADDVSSLAPHVDGVIMVIRAGFTSGRIANTALDILRLRKVNVIGLAFNAVQTNGGEYQHYNDKNYYPHETTA